MDPAVVPALVIDRVDADQLDVAGIDFVGQRISQLEIFVLEETPAGSGKNHHRPAELTEPQVFHLPAE